MLPQCWKIKKPPRNGGFAVFLRVWNCINLGVVLSKMLPCVNPILESALYIALITTGGVKCAVRVDALACSYSSGESVTISSLYSSVQFDFVSSNASARPPQPTYCDKISCSSGVASLWSNSSSCKRFTTSTFRLNFSFGLPYPSSSFDI